MFNYKFGHDELSLFEKGIIFVKTKCYSVMHEMMQQFMCSNLIYELLLLLETF